MRPEIAANTAVRDRFLKEAHAMAALHHDHIVSVLQAGTIGALPFLTMERLTAESLAQRLSRGPALSLPNPWVSRGTLLGL